MKAYALIANGSEEVECLAVVDLLKRASIDVKLVSVHEYCEIVSSHGIRIITDDIISNVDFSDADLIFTPGGLEGTRNMEKSSLVKKVLLEQNEKKKRIASICAGPSVLGKFGLLDDKKATVFPGFEDDLPNPVDQAVVTDGNITTARGLGLSFELGFELIKLLISVEKADEIKKNIQYTR